MDDHELTDNEFFIKVCEVLEKAGYIKVPDIDTVLADRYSGYSHLESAQLFIDDWDQ